MNKFKKIALGIILSTGLCCLAAAAACTAPTYYKLVFSGVGVDYVMEGNLYGFESGGTVKRGVEVQFKVIVGSNSTGDAKVLLNGEPLTPDADGLYSFIMSKESVVTVEGVSVYRTVIFDKNETETDDEGNEITYESWISYLDEDGNDMGDSVKVVGGEPVKFKLKASPYYDRYKKDTAGNIVYDDNNNPVTNYTVSCNSSVLTMDADGYYVTDPIVGDTTISVSGLEVEEVFTQRKRGDGSEENPYLIERPIDLYAMAAFINDTFSAASYMDKHYKLANDIDMEGEHLYVIGDASNSSAIFAGHFDGNGKTIHNFYITDEVYDQQTYNKEFLRCVGLFGQVVSTITKQAVIENLTLDDFRVELHATERINDPEDPDFIYAGALVGYGRGVKINNCQFTDGEINAVGDNNIPIFMGGIVGIMEAAYSETLTFDGIINACSTDIDINGVNSPRAAGGIVGYLISADITAISYVSNSYSLGAVSGAMSAGGIVGMMGRFSGVVNCYATGYINAVNSVNNSLIVEEMMYANAGGIAGFAENDTVISNCYAANEGLNASSVRGGAKYQLTGDFAGRYYPAGSDAIDGAALLTTGSLKRANGHTIDIFAGVLGWDESEWDFSGAYPTLKIPSSPRTVTITVKNGDTVKGTYAKSLDGLSVPISRWYDGTMPEYVTESGKRTSWGYYFDKALTQKVPYGFVPTSDTVLYVGASDYEEVSGRIYVSSELGVKAYIDFTPDGKAFFRQGGLNFTSEYIYDGNDIWIKYTCLANLLYSVSETNGAYYTFKCSETDDVYTLTAIGNIVTVGSDGSQSYEAVQMILSARVRDEDFGYGLYKTERNEYYSFNEDGTGVYVNASGARQSFTYTYVKSTQRISIVLANGGGQYADVGSDGVITRIALFAASQLDEFAGTWTTNANSRIKFAFDGMGFVTYTDGTVEETVAYSEAANGVTFDVGVTTYVAEFGADGVLYINEKGYFGADGFTGVWYMETDKEHIEINLEGYGSGDYGYATVYYTGSVIADVEAQYVVVNGGVSGAELLLYDGDLLIGDLVYDAATRTATGEFYSMRGAGYYANPVTFNMYDAFEGLWMADGDFDTLTFDGKALSAGGGKVTAVKSDGAPADGTYTSTDGFTATMTISGSQYSISYDELTERITVIKTGGSEQIVSRRDDWYGVSLYGGNTKYTFDGKGYIGGTVEVDDGTSVTELPYSIAADGTFTIDGKTLLPEGNVFDLDGVKLSFRTGFAGKWILTGINDDNITITEVDCNREATVTFSIDGETQVKTAVYDVLAQTLTITEGEDVARVTTVLGLLRGKELSVDVTGSDQSLYYVCINENDADAIKGEYTAESGAKWEFDGFGASVFASGSAIYTDEDGETTKYVYFIDAFGNVAIKLDGVTLFKEADSDDEDCFEGGAVKYKTVKADAMHGATVLHIGGGATEKFVFDGLGKLWKSADGEMTELYSYEVVNENKVKLTDADGKKYYGTIETRGLNKWITLTDIMDGVTVLHTLDGGATETLIFDGLGKLRKSVGGKLTDAYSYEVVDETTVRLTDAGGNEYVGVIEASGTENTITITAVDTQD